MRKASSPKEQSKRVRALTVAQARAEVKLLLAADETLETAPRHKALGDAVDWLGPANREFCERFERLAVRGRRDNLVLGAQAVGPGRRVGGLDDWPEVHQEEGCDDVAARFEDRPTESLPSLWHVAVLAAATLEPRAGPSVVYAELPDTPPPPPPRPWRDGFGCAKAPVLAALLAFALGHGVAGALCSIVAVWWFRIGHGLARGSVGTRAKGMAARERIGGLTLERARALAVAAADKDWARYGALCPLDTDQPLGPATREAFERWGYPGMAFGLARLGDLDRAKLGPSQLLAGYVCLGDEALVSRPNDDELLYLTLHGGPITVWLRWPSIWHYVVWELGLPLDQPETAASCAGEGGAA